MTGKDPENMTASELLRWLAGGDFQSNCRACHLFYASDECGGLKCGDWKRDIADKIDKELKDTRAKGISEGVDASMLQGAMLWAKANGWPDFHEGEDFGAWLDRCTYKKPVDDHNEPVQFGDEIELHRRSGGMNKGCLQEVYVNKGPVMILSFVGTYTACECRYDTECDVLKRPVPEALGADGLPIKVGETAYDTKTGIEIVVSRIAKDEGDNVIVCASGDICELQFDPRHITHTPPDTQEKIDRDKRKAAMCYWECADNECFSCPCKINGKKPSEYYGVFNCTVAQGMDIARRQAELYKRTGVDA